ncbi:MAG: DNA repair protein RecN, partial [Desulfobulbaceae bacterium]|nr:DNA repair protein RecN [Desulfobulbaceae bacterium]
DDRHTLLAQIRDMGFETDGSLVVKRILSTNGKSRYYVNHSLAAAKTTGKITRNLVNVASQHDHQLLLLPSTHLDLIDSLGALLPQRNDFSTLFDQWTNLKTNFDNLRNKEMEKEQRRDFLSFQYKEITEAGIRPGEDEELEVEKNRLKASDDLIQLGNESSLILNETVIDSLAQVKNKVDRMSSYDKTLTDLAEEIAGHSFQLEDNLAALRQYVESVENDPSRLDTVTARIDLLQQLKRKYGKSIERVLVYAEEIRAELEDLDKMDQRIKEIEKELGSIEKRVIQSAKSLSAARRKAVYHLTDAMKNEFQSLCFEGADFEVLFNGSEDPTLTDLTRLGFESAEFMFSANPGEPVKPLAKIASGGELSRLMLALKCLLAQKDQVETAILDEVDAGIGGKAAEAVAEKIKELAGHHQVLCITHLPQIASCADEHFMVFKKVFDKRTLTTISHLNDKSRINELARMLSGESVTSKTLAYATELLERNRR